MKWRADNLIALEKVAHEVITNAVKNSDKGKFATVVALHGNLGAGKTTLTKSIAKALGINDTITSPTFVIQKRFEIPAEAHGTFGSLKNLIHIDAYRIDLQDQLVKLGWNTISRDNDNIIVVEWPENVADVLPPTTTHVYLNFINETTREIEIR
jgi:tRNA threonylcarbamoyladenosine biosynthesis protein TsaE